jgi:hypothetical protein
VTFDRHSEHWYQGLRRDHSRQVRRATGSGDDYFNAARFRSRREFGHQRGSAVSRNDAAFMRNVESRQDFVGVAHRLPIGLAAHNHGDQRFFLSVHHPIIAFAEAEAKTASGKISAYADDSVESHIAACVSATVAAPEKRSFDRRHSTAISPSDFGVAAGDFGFSQKRFQTIATLPELSSAIR